MKFILNIFRRRKYSPIFRTLPHILKKRYGGDKSYTIGQVMTVARMLKFNEQLIIYAVAVACTKNVFVSLTQKDYLEARTMIADLCYMDEVELNCSSLIKRFSFRSVSNSNEDLSKVDVNLLSGGGHGGD